MNIDHPALQRQFSVVEKLLAYLDKNAPYVRQPSGMAQTLARASLFRARDVLRASYAVAKIGLPAEVSALGRVLCESTIQMAWITGDDSNQDERAQTIYDEGVIKASKAIEAYLRHNPNAKPDPQEWQDYETELKTARQRLSPQPGKKFKETPIATLAAQTSSTLAEHYDLFYREMCIHAHASVRSFQNALEGSSERMLDKALFMTSINALLLIKSCAPLLGLPDTSTLESEANAIFQQGGNRVDW